MESVFKLVEVATNHKQLERKLVIDDVISERKRNSLNTGNCFDNVKFENNFLRSLLVSFIWEYFKIINTKFNTVFVILHGSNKITIVCIWNTNYSDILSTPQ